VTAALFVYSPSPHFNEWDGLRLEEGIKDVFARSELDERLKVALHEKKTSSTVGSAGEEDGERQAEVILTKDHFRQVSQIDVVPTIALLMGLPIPFGNLGGIIPELFLGNSPPPTRLVFVTQLLNPSPNHQFLLLSRHRAAGLLQLRSR
jgi:hypothetical protein